MSKQRYPPPDKPQPFRQGQKLLCHYKPLHFTIPSPCLAERVEKSDHFTSGWAVEVRDTDGAVRRLDSGLFKSYE